MRTKLIRLWVVSFVVSFGVWGIGYLTGATLVSEIAIIFNAVVIVIGMLAFFLDRPNAFGSP